ncbi:hypothetical protein [Deefgea salmonis]|uniref:Uncharacterized protein n=1 Tax=Deefgea salmonis TaxID=2875502 RepID=A0ABS8BIZ7_9NEIS|nr:hypothetical protein [Deefgea salmonis]MCB5195700.1 hypothetical protein [Deefgea salmonis]
MMNRAAFGQSLPFNAVVANFAITAVFSNHQSRIIRLAATVADFATVGVERRSRVFQAGRVMIDSYGYFHLAIANKWLQSYTREVA